MPKPLFQAEGQEPEGCRGARDRGQVDFRLPTFKIAGSDPEGAQSAFQGLPVKLFCRFRVLPQKLILGKHLNLGENTGT